MGKGFAWAFVALLRFVLLSFPVYASTGLISSPLVSSVSSDADDPSNEAIILGSSSQYIDFPINVSLSGTFHYTLENPDGPYYRVVPSSMSAYVYLHNMETGQDIQVASTAYVGITNLDGVYTVDGIDGTYCLKTRNHCYYSGVVYSFATSVLEVNSATYVQANSEPSDSDQGTIFYDYNFWIWFFGTIGRLLSSSLFAIVISFLFLMAIFCLYTLCNASRKMP